MQNKLVVLESNQRFYDAFNKKDLDLMTRIWLNEPTVQCVLPGWDMLNGFKPIIESWRRIFLAYPNPGEHTALLAHSTKFGS
jgi:hypothetical protein